MAEHAERLDGPAMPDRPLRATYYTDQAVLAHEREHLFFRTWQFAGHSGQVPEPGQYITLSLFDQNLILIRGHDGEIRGFYNVCPHRGHRLLEGEGRCQQIVCPYHAWTYLLDGRLKGARGRQRSRDEIRLSPVRVEMLLDFIFINLDPDAAPLAEWAPRLAQQMLQHCPDLPLYRPAGDGQALGHSYHCRANWKGMVENYLECYHCETAHPTFRDMIDIPASRFAMHDGYTFQAAPTAMRAETRAFPLDLTHDVTTGHFWWLFPNTMLGQFPGVPGFYVSRLDPLNPDETARITTTLVPPTWPDADAPRRDRLRAEWTEHVVSPEDKALCEAVQQGMHQRGFDQGWYVIAPDAHNISEHAMRHFHALYLAAMGRAGPVGAA